MASACHSHHALRDVDGEPVHATGRPGGKRFLDLEWQGSHRLLAAMQNRGVVLTPTLVSGVVALVSVWPGCDEGPEAP
jgi:hypothetical protein